MKKTLKREKGITIMMLTIVLIIMAILAMTIASITSNNLKESKSYAFLTELDAIERKLQLIKKEINLGVTAYDNIGTKYAALDESKKSKVQHILDICGISDYNDFCYLSKADLEKIGIVNVGQEVIVSFEDAIVFSYTGLKINGDVIYSADEIVGIKGGTIIE